VPPPLILDVDTGVDDAVALLYAVASPEVELVAATTVTGNAHVSKTTRNTLLVLELAGRAGVEVAAGAARPLTQPWQAFPVVHGVEGLGSYEPREPSRAPSERDAPQLIVEEARRRPGEVVLVATGPLTNVALALELEPALPDLLAGFSLMGGAFRSGGNVTPRAEANVWMDPEAAARVFAAWSGTDGARLPRCLGLDVTEQVVLGSEDLARICAAAADSALAELLHRSVSYYIDFHASNGRRSEGASMHDPLAVAATIDPSLCAWTATRVEVELEGRWTRGETVTDLHDIRRTRWSEWAQDENAVVATSVDAPAVLERMVQRLASLVEGRA
jgi:purine nucleosidase